MGEKPGTEKKPNRRKGILKGVLWTVAGIWLLLLIALQLILSPSFLSRVTQRVASEYVDGELSFSRIDASMFRSFPNLNVSIEDFSITYPHDRFAAYDSLSPFSALITEAGRAGEADTLAHFDRFDLSVDYVSLLFSRIRVRKARLSHPRIFLRQYDSTAADWNMFRTSPASEEDDSTDFSIPYLSLGKVSLEGRPTAVYFNLKDTISGSVSMKEMVLGGRYSPKKGKVENLSFKVDSMFFGGRLPSDTLAIGMDELAIRDHGSHFDLGLRSKLFLAMKGTGRMQLPLSIDAQLIPDIKGKVFQVRDMNAMLATLRLKADGLADLSGDSTYIKADASIERERIQDITDFLAGNFPILKSLSTDAEISLDAHCDGFYVSGTKSLPPLHVHFEVPDAGVSWEGIDRKGRFDLEADALSEDGRLRADVKDFCFSIDGFGISMKASSEDLLGDDPTFAVDGDLHAVLDSLAGFIPDSLGISAHGDLAGRIGGAFKLSQLDPWNFSDLGLNCDLRSSGIDIRDSRDSINAHLGRTAVTLGAYSHSGHESGHQESSHQHTGLTATVDSLSAEYGASTFIRGSGISILAHNADEKIDGDASNHPIHGHLDIRSVGIMDMDLNFIGVRESENVFQVRRRKIGRQLVPYLNLSSGNERVTIRAGANRVTAEGLSASVAAHPAKPEDKARRKHLVDSLQKVYPGVPKDSLFHKAFSSRTIPDYLSEKDFEKKDLHIQLGESLMEYYRSWDLSGKLKLADCSLITPYFPLDNHVRKLEGSFTNDRIDLSGIRVESGSSDISATGSVSGLKRALASSRGRLSLNLDIDSDFIDLNEIIVAAIAGSKYEGSDSMGAIFASDDTEYLNAIREQAVLDSVPETSLLVIPANLEAKVSLNASTLKYSDMETSWLSSDIEMKERCLQLTNAMAMTNMGDVFLEGFYSTRTKKDLKAGFDLTLSNITAEKVIQLFPAVDSIVPMLQAFKGLLDCEIAATSSIDTAMNVIMPSISGMIKIDGRDLSLAESESLNKLRKTLRFKDRDSSAIDRMSVRGIIRDDKLEVFPFILKVDRYTIALDGTQRFDQNFKYHISALKSPIPMRFGVNLSGTFDDWRWKLGKARYKSTDVPVFEEQVDGLRFNLMNAIHNIFDRGVENALRQNEASQAAIESKKAELEYSGSDPEELDEEERKELESYMNGAGEG